MIANHLRKVAARSHERFDERCSAEFSQIFERVLALMTRAAMRAVPIVQEEIFAAQRRNAGAFKYHTGEVFVGCQRCGGGVVLRKP